MSNKNNIHVVARAVILDQAYILLCKTLDLPVNFYFLPGGHIEHGEPAQAALVRELREEIGAQISIKRFLGCLEYSFEIGHSNICHNHEYNFIFEAESEKLKVNNNILQLEPHIQLVWIPFSDINTIDFRAEPLKKLMPEWLKLNYNNAFYSVM